MVVTGRYTLDAEGTFLHTAAHETALHFTSARPPNLPTQLEPVLVGRFYTQPHNSDHRTLARIWSQPCTM